VTAHPDDDWKRIFIGLILVAACSFAWNVYFFIGVKNGVAVSDDDSTTQAADLITSKETQLKSLVGIFDAKKAKNEAVMTSGMPNIQDPSY